MKSRTTLILLLVAGCLFAYIKFVDSKQATTVDTTRDAKKVIKFDREIINAITVKNAEGTIELRKKENDVWMIENPIKDRADTMIVNGLFTTAEFLKADEILGADKPVEKDQLKEFGLSNSETKVTFAGGDKPVELLFGKDTAVEGKLYVKVADDKRVFVIGNELKNQITKKLDQFRDRRLSELTTGQVNKVTLKTSAGEIELAKKNDHWSLTKPFQARGDDARIGDLISQVTTARIESFVADAGNLAAYGLQAPRAAVSLFAEGNEQPTVLQIGDNPKDEKTKDQTYAKLSTRDAVVILPKSIESLLGLQPNDLRDKNLLRVDADIVDRITIEGAGREKIVLARNGEAWVRKADKDLPVNSAEAARMLNELRLQQVTKFEADVATDLEKYGLNQPSVKVTFSSYATENTAETKAGEKPIVTVLFGKIEGDSVYAKLDDEPFIVSVPKTILDSIFTDPLQWQELTIYKLKPEEIISIDVTKGEEPTISLERDKDKWKLAKGDGNVNQIAAQSLVNTLSTLRAVRWEGATKPEDGFDKPSAVITFKTSGNVTGKLTIGAAGKDDTWRASAEGLAGTFAISRPDKEAFLGALIDKSPATAPPTQPSSASAPTPLPSASETPAAPNPK
jgi:Domain of unknown function (DUF4340)